MDSRKSSASSTPSKPGSAQSLKQKLSISQLPSPSSSFATNSKPPVTSPNKSSIVSVNNKLAALELSSIKPTTSQKTSYLNDATENDIKEDKFKKRYDNLMAKFYEVSAKEYKQQAMAKAGSKDNLISKSQTSSVNSKQPKLPAIITTQFKSNVVSASLISHHKSSTQSHVELSLPKISSLQNKPASKSNTNEQEKAKNNYDNDQDVQDEDDSTDEEEVRSPIKAPNELLEEFLVHVMSKKWKDAHKLCKFILMYEPNNSLAKEFMPLIESQLNLTESSSESDSSDSDDDDDNDDEDSKDEESSDGEGDEYDTSSDEDEDKGNDQTNAKKVKINHKETKMEMDDDDDVQMPSKMK